MKVSPKGNNQGAALAKGEYLCILNPDTVVAEDTFTKLISFAEAQEKTGIIGVKLIDGTGNFLRESKRGVPTPWVALPNLQDCTQYPQNSLENTTPCTSTKTKMEKLIYL